MSDGTLTIAELMKAGEASLKTGPFGTQLKASEYVEHGTPVINVRNIGFGDLRPEKLEYLADHTVERVRDHKIMRGDIVFGRKGAVERHLFVGAKQEGWIQGSDCLRLRITSARVDPRFVSYCFLTVQHAQWIQAQASHGATMASLNQDILGRIAIPKFAFVHQRRIADILSGYDDLIENNRRRIAILEDMARRLFDEWFGCEMDDGSARPVRIDTMIDFDPKTQVSKQGFKPFLPMPCVPTNSMVVSDWEEREGNSGSKFLNGDTLLARITPCLENGKTAFVDFLPESAAGFGSTEFIVMRGHSVPPEFVYCLARSDAFREHAIKSMSGATGRQRVSSAAVAQFEIARPDPERLNRFGSSVRPMFKMIRSLADANANLRTTCDLLLPRLISGEIDVHAVEEALETAAT